MSRRDKTPPPDRFWPKVQRTLDDTCWEWQGYRGADGYGRFRVATRGAPALAHRFAYETAFGPIPPGLLVCHRCDNPPCVRPSHLFLGTQQDNIRDCSAKGRLNTVGRLGMTACKWGHPYTPENTRITPQGWRDCRQCKRNKDREYARAKAVGA